jgi:hypothetical protein
MPVTADETSVEILIGVEAARAGPVDPSDAVGVDLPDDSEAVE